MTTADADLIERIRELLAGESSTREVSMFGGRSVMVDDKMVVSARKEGALLVRVPEDQYDELIQRPGADPAEMGTGRSMGRGWISVSAEGVDTEEQLAFWLGVALEHNRRRRATVTTRPRRKRRLARDCDTHP